MLRNIARIDMGPDGDFVMAVQCEKEEDFCLGTFIVPKTFLHGKKHT